MKMKTQVRRLLSKHKSGRDEVERTKPGGRGASPRAREQRTKQTGLAFRCWGGARPGAGRKPKGERAMLPHDARPAHAARFPVLVTTRLRPGLPSLRRPGEAARIRAALASARNAEAAGSEGSLRFQVVHHTIQSNHLHLIVEAADRGAMTAGMRGLLVRIARALNRMWGRSGSVFADRFHERELHKPREVRNALVYVLQNLRKHGISLDGPDPLSSGPEFDGWQPAGATAKDSSPHRTTRDGGKSLWHGLVSFLRAGRTELPRPTTWLLGVGWQRHGPIDPGESPRVH